MVDPCHTHHSCALAVLSSLGKLATVASICASACHRPNAKPSPANFRLL